MFVPTPKGDVGRTGRAERRESLSSSEVQSKRANAIRSEQSKHGPIAPTPTTAPSPPVPSAAAGNDAGTSGRRRAPLFTQATQKAMAELNDIRERRNWLIHQLYTRQEFVSCLAVIEAQLRDTEGTCEYALYVKGLLKRMEGHLTESMELLQAAVLVSPESTEARKQFGRALFLLGRHEEALEAFRESQALSIARMQEDWEVELHIGRCELYLGHPKKALVAFAQSLSFYATHDGTYQTARTLEKIGEDEEARLLIERQLTGEKNHPKLRTLLGQMYLKKGDIPHAFGTFGECLAEDPANLKALMAVSSIIQSNGEYDAALLKYRIAVAKVPDSPQLWNNIGACFYGKQARELRLGSASTETTSGHNLYAAVACLRKSIILAPFEWITNYNLGVVFLSLGRYVSAFHYLSASINLNPKHAPSFMYLGVCLSLMNDIDNARHAYERAIAMEDDLLFRANYAITLYNSNLLPESAAQLHHILPVWRSLSEEQRTGSSPSLPGTLAILEDRLAGVAPGVTSSVSPNKDPNVSQEQGTKDEDAEQPAENQHRVRKVLEAAEEEEEFRNRGTSSDGRQELGEQTAASSIPVAAGNGHREPHEHQESADQNQAVDDDTRERTTERVRHRKRSGDVDAHPDHTQSHRAHGGDVVAETHGTASGAAPESPTDGQAMHSPSATLASTSVSDESTRSNDDVGRADMPTRSTSAALTAAAEPSISEQRRRSSGVRRRRDSAGDGGSDKLLAEAVAEGSKADRQNGLSLAANADDI